MSASVQVVILCDSEAACSARHAAGAPTVAEAHFEAKRDGWRVNIPSRWLQPCATTYDLCPRHASEADE
jgi:hypothetical protein